jgi:hypothetical protein
MGIIESAFANGKSDISASSYSYSCIASESSGTTAYPLGFPRFGPTTTKPTPVTTRSHSESILPLDVAYTAQRCITLTTGTWVAGQFAFVLKGCGYSRPVNLPVPGGTCSRQPYAIQSGYTGKEDGPAYEN